MIAGIVLALLMVLWIALALNCPSAGIALTSNAARLHRLKNRTAFPQPADFDSHVTLEALLEPGEDSGRWSTARAGRIEGEVIDVAYARPEATNCFNPCARDVHILLAKNKGVGKSRQVVLEVTPVFRAWAGEQGMDWSEESLKKLVGHWCEFEGWLYFDAGHTEEAENSSPGNPENWRATAWEIHPVTKFTVIK